MTRVFVFCLLAPGVSAVGVLAAVIAVIAPQFAFHGAQNADSSDFGIGLNMSGYFLE
jgi:hypothetical protein